MLLGGHGVISVTANVTPKLMHQMCVAALTGNLPQALKTNQTMFALHQHLFIEPNPIPVKWVLSEMGRIQKGIRLPLTWLAEQYHQVLRDAMRQSEIL
jgi:4-hydroxy-tetrahydrodipicolinate synthase